MQLTSNYIFTTLSISFIRNSVYVEGNQCLCRIKRLYLVNFEKNHTVCA
jgi:hypothetical protein